MMKIKKISIIIFFLIVGCYPVSHIIVGEKRAPINPNDIKLYVDFPEKYQKIAIVEAGSGFALKDPSIDFTHQKKTDKALKRLKNEAALLGANGIVIQNLSTLVIENVNPEGNTTSYTDKAIIATAIFVE